MVAMPNVLNVLLTGRIAEIMSPHVADTCKCCNLANSMPQPAGRLSVPVDCLCGNLSIKAFSTQRYQSIYDTVLV